MHDSQPLDDVALDRRAREILAADPELLSLARTRLNDAYLAALKRAAAEQPVSTAAAVREAPDAALDREARALVKSDPQLQALASSGRFNDAYLAAFKRVKAEAAYKAASLESRRRIAADGEGRAAAAGRLTAARVFVGKYAVQIGADSAGTRVPMF